MKTIKVHMDSFDLGYKTAKGQRNLQESVENYRDLRRSALWWLAFIGGWCVVFLATARDQLTLVVVAVVLVISMFSLPYLIFQAHRQLTQSQGEYARWLEATADLREAYKNFLETEKIISKLGETMTTREDEDRWPDPAKGWKRA